MAETIFLKSAPRISVVMPVYNTGSHLSRALRSILNQTWKDLEVLCVDDGSTDDSLKILQKLELTDRRIRILSRPNTGIVGALNDGVALACGEFIARMDADDFSLPQRFAAQIAFLEAHPEVVCLGCCALKVDADGDPIEIWRVPLTHEAIDAHHIKNASGGGIIHPTAMLRRETLVKAGGYARGTDLAEDLDLWLRLAENGRLANLEDVLLHYRVAATGLSVSRRVEQEHQTLRVLNAARVRRNLPPLAAREPWLPSEEYQLRLNIISARAEKFWRSARKYAWRLIRLRPSSKLGWLALIQSSFHLASGGHDAKRRGTLCLDSEPR